MMKRLIDADALKEYIDCGHLRNPCEVCFSERDVVDLIDAQPTIDAIPIAYIEKCIAELDTWIPKFKKENTGNLILTKEYLKWILNWWKFMNKEYVNE